MIKRRFFSMALSTLAGGVAATLLLAGLGRALVARADDTYQALPFTQNWPHANLITVTNSWIGVRGIVGYNGASSGIVGDVDPQLVTTDTVNPADIEIGANRVGPSGNITDVVAEFERHPTVENDRVVGLRPQTGFAAPFLLLYLNTTGLQNIQVQYLVRDIDLSGHDAEQRVALHYRIGESGLFTNVPAAYIADATIGSTSTFTSTAVNVTLPAALDNQPMVQLRILTTNDYNESDEWIGIDDINISGTSVGGVPYFGGSSKTVNTTTAVPGDLLTYTLTVSNSGTTAGYALTDTLPANVEFVNASPGLTGTGTLTASGILSGGSELAYVLTVRVSPAFSGTIVNTADLSGDGLTRTLDAPPVEVDNGTGPTPANFSGSAKTVNGTNVTAGSLLTYTLTISNSGSTDATFALTDTLSSNVAFVSAPGMIGTSTLTASGSLAGGAQQAYVVTVRPNLAFSGTLTNTAQLSGDDTSRSLVAPNVTVHAPGTNFSLFLPIVTK